METTIRYHMNPNGIAYNHNRVDEIRAQEKHVRPDPTTGHIHEDWGGYSSIEEAYQDIFGQAIEEYNEKQTRKDRKMTVTDYMKTVAEDTRGKPRKVKNKETGQTEYVKPETKRLIYEVVLSCGNTDKARNDDGTVMYDDGYQVHPQAIPEEVNKAVCRRYFETFCTRNPYLRIGSADWHADEGYTNQMGNWEYGTSHLHLGVIPAATGYKRGLSVQSSIGKALSLQGIADTTDENGKRICAYTAWETREAAYMEELLQDEYQRYCEAHQDYAAEHGALTIVHPVTERRKSSENLPPKLYKAAQDMEETISDLTAEIQDKQSHRSKLIQDNTELDRANRKRTKELQEAAQMLQAHENDLQARERALQAERVKLQAEQEKALQVQQRASERIREAEQREAEAEKLKAVYQEKIRQHDKLSNGVERTANAPKAQPQSVSRFDKGMK